VDESVTKTKVWELVCDFFEGDEVKTMRWLMMPNPSLGHIKPIIMLKTKPEKLEKIVRNWLRGDYHK